MSKSQKLDDKQILTKLSRDFHELVSDKEVLRTSVEHFLNNVVDELTLGIIFDLHRKYKTNSYEIDMEEDEPDDEENSVDVFAQYDMKKAQECVCPICDRSVAAVKFAPHLETCMGMGRSRSRNATRRVASNSSNSKDRESSSFSGIPSDDEDDIDWNSGNKRGKKKKRNGTKKSKGGTPKKSGEFTKPESANVEVEVEETDLTSLRDLLQDHSNSSSPADSVSSSQSNNSSKKKEKSKSKKNKRDRSSPSSSISVE